ncbi:MAG TPA: glycine cleavage T C-terminal barrel domain-containing protein, partial [Ferruginibacter sp.]|nr:glycine cleavage T C-terminal barrel domain-containing protein [Ferruginibacter sp.]
MTERGIARHGYDICNAAGEVIGHVTSGTQSPSLGKAIGLGYVQMPYTAIDSPIFIQIR